MDLGEIEFENIAQQTLGETVLTHHLGGALPPGGGQGQRTVVLHNHEPVALQAAHGLGDGRPGLLESLGDARPERDNPLLLELVYGPQVHFCGVYKVAHGWSSFSKTQCISRAVSGVSGRQGLCRWVDGEFTYLKTEKHNLFYPKDAT